MQDDTDDADFPFAVDDVDPDSRPGYVLASTSYFLDHSELHVPTDFFFLSWLFNVLLKQHRLPFCMSNDHIAWEPLQSS
jgi:hypothetical protein